MYDYSGYFNVCLIGGEIEKPTRNIPRVVLLSIVILAVLYMLMSLSIIGVVPWQQAMHSNAIVSDYIEHLYGKHAASLMTLLILWVGFASVFCVLLGYTRVPYAAAVEGHFFSRFGRTPSHPQFPRFFRGLLRRRLCRHVRLSSRRFGQRPSHDPNCHLVRRSVHRGGPFAKNARQPRPFSMPLYPLPVVLALAGWVFIFAMSGWQYMVSAIALVAIGIIGFRIFTRSANALPAKH